MLIIVCAEFSTKYMTTKDGDDYLTRKTDTKRDDVTHLTVTEGGCVSCTISRLSTWLPAVAVFSRSEIATPVMHSGVACWTLQVLSQTSYKLIGKHPSDFQGFWTNCSRHGGQYWATVHAALTCFIRKSRSALERRVCLLDSINTAVMFILLWQYKSYCFI